MFRRRRQHTGSSRPKQTHHSHAPGVVGTLERRKPNIRPEHRTFHAGDVLTMFSDGIKRDSVSDIEHRELLREHPIVVAEYLVEHFARSNDDAIVLVARS